MPSDQGRARGLYDEQLQRKQQEKALHRAEGKTRPILFEPARAEPEPTAA